MSIEKTNIKTNVAILIIYIIKFWQIVFFAAFCARLFHKRFERLSCKPLQRILLRKALRKPLGHVLLRKAFLQAFGACSFAKSFSASFCRAFFWERLSRKPLGRVLLRKPFRKPLGCVFLRKAFPQAFGARSFAKAFPPAFGVRFFAKGFPTSVCDALKVFPCFSYKSGHFSHVLRENRQNVSFILRKCGKYYSNNTIYNRCIAAIHF